jgi:OOP family OmpA-OmpF porin
MWALLALSMLAITGCSGAAQVEAKAPPPPADSDGDGIPDNVDKCVGEKEDGLPPDPKDGCKTSDSDQDGIPDDRDKCIGQKEDNLPPDPTDGCPTTDPDNDGILGDKDKCPNEPETVNGYQDQDGCPDTPPRVSVTKTEVKINEKILFAFGKATIDERSNDLIDEIAKVVIENPQIEYFEVAGHADKIGTDPFNVNLTRQRAQAVLVALEKRGLEGRRMRAVGYGRYCPRDTADTDQARDKNRRVEFKILRVDGVDTGVQLGCEEAASHGVKSGGVPAGAPSRAQNEKGQEAAKAILDKVRAEHKETKAAEKAEAKAASKPAAATNAKANKPDKDKDKKAGAAATAKSATKNPPPPAKGPPGKLGPTNAPTSPQTK